MTKMSPLLPDELNLNAFPVKFSDWFHIQLLKISGEYMFIKVRYRTEWDGFWSMQKKLTEDYKRCGPTKVLPYYAITVGKIVVAKIRTSDSNELFIRARVETIENGQVSIFDLDDTTQYIVSSHDVYDFAGDIACSVSFQAVKVKAEGLGIVDGMTAEQIRTLEDRIAYNHSSVLCVRLVSRGKSEQPPVVRIFKILQDRILKYISHICEVPCPEPLNPLVITLCYYSSDGYIWYQSNQKMVLKIESMLEYMKDTVTIASELHGVEYSKLSDRIFVCLYKDGTLKRVKVTCDMKNNDTKVKVLCIDYGYITSVLTNELYDLQNIDVGLHSLSAQARKAKLDNVETLDEEIMALVLQESSRRKWLVMRELDDQNTLVVDINVNMVEDLRLKSLINLLFELGAATKCKDI